MRKYLVTGGAGFIGSRIVKHLLEKDEDVRVLDNFSTGKRGNLGTSLEKIELIEGDIRDPETVKRSMVGVDYVFHEAALSSVLWSVRDPKLTHEVNTGGTLNVLTAARDRGVRKVIYASSAAVYGNGQVLPKREDMKPEPLSPYAVSKLAGERYCEFFSNTYGLNAIVVRYFNVFGPGQDLNTHYSAVIPRFISDMLRGKRPVIYGDGTQSRDFVYVANVVHANMLCCNTDVSFGIFNVACGKSITLLNLVDEISRVLGMEARPVFVEPRGMDVKHSQADIALARSVLAYEPIVTFQEGLSRTINHFAQDYHEGQNPVYCAYSTALRRA
jgi:UDP-glucose 4-epimerase